MTESPIERAARAMYEDDCQKARVEATWDREPPSMHERYENQARVAIDVYREAVAQESAAKRERAIAEAVRTFAVATNATVNCQKCEGRGYHHGFGDNGHDPDWCSECGGAQFVGEFTEGQAMAVAIAAYERVMAEPHAAQPREEGK